MFYTYECSKCGQFEIQMSHTDLPLKKCPTCRNKKVERIYSAGVTALWKTSGTFSKSNHGKGE